MTTELDPVAALEKKIYAKMIGKRTLKIKTKTIHTRNSLGRHIFFDYGVGILANGIVRNAFQNGGRPCSAIKCEGIPNRSNKQYFPLQNEKYMKNKQTTIHPQKRKILSKVH
jgi:hypothetical protein